MNRLIQAAKRAFATVDVMTAAVERSRPGMQRELEYAVRKELSLPPEATDDNVLVALAKRADAVAEFNPLTERLEQLEAMVGSLSTELIYGGGKTCHELLGRANKLIGNQS